MKKLFIAFNGNITIEPKEGEKLADNDDIDAMTEFLEMQFDVKHITINNFRRME